MLVALRMYMYIVSYLILLDPLTVLIGGNQGNNEQLLDFWKVIRQYVNLQLCRVSSIRDTNKPSGGPNVRDIS